MRVAVLSDVHANLPALRAVLDAATREGVDGYLCTGDLVGYGAQPDECVEVVRDLGVRCVAGNHDLIATGALGDHRAGPLARETLAWTRDAISATTRAFLTALPRTLGADGWLLAHGSPVDPEEYVRTPARAQELLADLDGEAPEGLLLGHTHHHWAVAARDGELLARRTGLVGLRPGQRHLLNAGSVGQSRDGDELARFLVVDTDARTASFRAVAYDVAESARALRRAGLPVRALLRQDRSPRELALAARRRVVRRAERLRGR